LLLLLLLLLVLVVIAYRSKMGSCAGRLLLGLFPLKMARRKREELLG
jgi:hypothetical protein